MNTITTGQRIIQNFVLIWLNPHADESDVEFQNDVRQIRRFVNIINVFTDSDRCVDFLSEIKNEKAYIIISDAREQHIVSLIHDILQLDSIYLFCESMSQQEQWMQQWSKIKGIFTEISPICDLLQIAIRQYDQDPIPISFIPTNTDLSNENLDQLDQSFMYTQILKEILLEINFDKQSIKDFANCCRNQCAENAPGSEIIVKFERDYDLHSPVWWYSSYGFLYSMINRALRNQEMNILMKAGFFIRDLHQHIRELYQKQSTEQETPFIVYRGQGLSSDDFEKFRKTNGGLMSFNSFLSTSKDQNISRMFAESNGSKKDLIGIIFEIIVDPLVSSALLDEAGNFHEENEVLFSMHTIFRIDGIKQMAEYNQLWHVKLVLTSDNDQQLDTLTERIRKETEGYTGWDRFGRLLITIGEFNKAEEVYQTLFYQTFDTHQKAYLCNQLGITKLYQGNLVDGILLYEKTLELYQNILPSNHPLLATSYNNIECTYEQMGQFSKAFSFHEKALQIRQNVLPNDHLELAMSFNNISTIYDHIGEYSKAISYCEKALNIYKKNLPENHPDLAKCYNNMGDTYRMVGQYSKAIEFYEKMLEMRLKTLPPNHPSLAVSYDSIGSTYIELGNYSMALSTCEKALQIRQKSIPSNDIALGVSYNNIGEAYRHMGEYSKALLFYEKALKISKKIYPSDHPFLANILVNIGSIYDNLGDYSKGLSSYEKAVDILQKQFSSNHPCLAHPYAGIGIIYDKMGKYSKALKFHEKALAIRQNVLPPNHPFLGTSYNNIGAVYFEMKDYWKALPFFG